METVIKVLSGTVLVFGMIFVLAAICAYPTKLVVDFLFTQQVLLTLFGVTKLTFWKAFWLNFICGWLFKKSSS